MPRMLGENLDEYLNNEGAWVRCVRCGHLLCRASEDWQEAAVVRMMEPKRDAMSQLLRPYWYRQWCCPSCGVLFETNLVTEEMTV